MKVFVPEYDPSKHFANRQKRRGQKLDIKKLRRVGVYHTCSDPKVFDPQCRRDVELARIMRGLADPDGARQAFHFAGEAMKRT